MMTGSDNPCEFLKVVTRKFRRPLYLCSMSGCECPEDASNYRECLIRAEKHGAVIDVYDLVDDESIIDHPFVAYYPFTVQYAGKVNGVHQYFLTRGRYYGVSKSRCRLLAWLKGIAGFPCRPWGNVDEDDARNAREDSEDSDD